jgi:CcmD family protein
MNRALHRLFRLALVSLSLVFAALPVAAQTFPGSDAGSQNLRAYHFVFLAYAIAWVFVFGWIVSVARRLARLEKRLQV